MIRKRFITLMVLVLVFKCSYSQDQLGPDILQTSGVATGFALAVIPINLDYTLLKLNKSGNTYTGISTGLSYMMASGFLDHFGSGQFGGYLALDLIRNMKKTRKSGSVKEFEFRLGMAYYLENPGNSNWLSVTWWPLINIGSRVFYKDTPRYFRFYFGTGGIGIGFGRRLGS